MTLSVNFSLKNNFSKLFRVSLLHMILDVVCPTVLVATGPNCTYLSLSSQCGRSVLATHCRGTAGDNPSLPGSCFQSSRNVHESCQYPIVMKRGHQTIYVYSSVQLLSRIHSRVVAKLWSCYQGAEMRYCEICKETSSLYFGLPVFPI